MSSPLITADATSGTEQVTPPVFVGPSNESVTPCPQDDGSFSATSQASWFEGDGVRRGVTAFEVRDATRIERTASETRAEYMHGKLKYHRRLVQQAGHMSPRAIQNLASPPLHVLPRHFFVRLPFGLDSSLSDSQGRQGSIGFIFTIVTTMMGATILSLPWGFQQTGLVASICLIFFFGAVAFYSCSIILTWGAQPGHQIDDFSKVCEIYLGPCSRHIANWTSILILWGAAMCFHVLISSNIQSVVLSVDNHFSGQQRSLIFCCGTGDLQYLTTAFIVGMAVLPMLSVDVSRLAGLASYGFLSLAFNGMFLTSTALIDISKLAKYPREQLGNVRMVGGVSDTGTFVGMIGLSLFVHSVLLPIANNHVHATTSPSIVRRDLGIAYGIAIMLYICMGAAPAVAFQLGRNVIPNYIALGAGGLPQNILLEYQGFPVGALIGRTLVALQLCVVYPIMAAVTRKQFFAQAFGTSEPIGIIAVVFNMVFVGVCTVVASVYPYPGSVVGYVGAYTAVVYMLWLPILVQLSALKQTQQLTWGSVVGNLSIAVVGTGIVLLQFF